MYLLIILLLVCFLPSTLSCTSFAVSPSASDTLASYVTYNADDHDQYGYLRYIPSSYHNSTSFREIYDGDTRVYHGSIPEAQYTYNVVHYANEYGVAIGESTFGGLDILQNYYNGSIMDYGSLMQVGLQRSTSARQLIKTMGQLVQDYGYVSSGESFSIADSTEAWIMEMIGKGSNEKGAVWVARRVPDGFIVAHANQARIQKFPLNDPDTMYSDDVVTFAIKMGLYPASAPLEDFSFSDTYNPLTWDGARACECRVWSIYQNVTNGGMDEYLDYARGWNLTNRMPLWVKPAAPLSRLHIFELMRDRYQGTFFEFDDTNTDIGAGAFFLPYRPRPLEYTVDGKTYANERAVATQQTLSNMIVEIRSGYPAFMGTVVWFGVDDTFHTVRIPIYAGVSRIPKPYAFGVADATVFSFNSAFWVFNMVSNLAYSGFNYINPDIQAEITVRHAAHFAALNRWDAQILSLYKSGDLAGAIELATSLSETLGENLVPQWLALWQRLFVKFMDNDIRTTVPGNWQPDVAFQSYPDSINKRVVQETGDHYLLPGMGFTATAKHSQTQKRKGV